MATPPIDIELVAEALGVCKIIRADIDCDGMLHPIGRDAFTVVLNKNHSLTRQRFSCAHEVAHILLADERRPSIARRIVANAREKLESDCNNLASEILMPRAPFVQRVSSMAWSLSSIPDLSTDFRTSMEATARRYVEMIDEACALFVWRRSTSEKSGSPKLCSFHKSPTMKCSFLQIDERTQRVNSQLIYADGGLQGTPGSYERVRISNRNRASFDTVYLETLAYGSGPNRRVINAVYPGRRASGLTKSQWVHDSTHRRPLRELEGQQRDK